MTDEEKKTYGIWIPGEGWVRGKDNKVYADYSLSKSRQVARLLGRGARVYFIDASIVDLERQYIEQEKKTLWQKIKTTINRLQSNSSKKTIRN